MPITRTAMIDDDGSGTTGTILNNAWKQELYNQIDGFVNAAWVDVPFNAANFTASGGAGWAVAANNVTHLAYAVTANTAALTFTIGGGTPSATISIACPFLYVTIPGLPPPTRFASMPFSYYVSGAGAGTGNASIAVGQNRLDLIRDIAGTPWPAIGGGGFMYLQGVVVYSR